jgi:S1-C subfamily serine protease
VKAESAKITVKEGWQFSAPLVGRDPATDIAVLQIQGASNLTAIAFGDSRRRFCYRCQQVPATSSGDF